MLNFNLIGDLVDSKSISIEYISSIDQIADILKKSLKYDLFEEEIVDQFKGTHLFACIASSV